MAGPQETKFMSDDELLKTGYKFAIGVAGGGLSAAAMPFFPPAVGGVAVFGEEAIRNLVIFVKNVNKNKANKPSSQPTAA